MRAEENSKSQRKKKPGKLIRWAAIVVAVLIVLAILVVPAYVSSESGRKTILARINNSIDGKADFAALSMSWWKGIKITDFSFSDNAGQTLVKIKQILTKPHYGSLIFGSLSFGQTEVHEPRVNINLTGRSPQTSEAVQAGKTAGPPVLPIKRIDLVVKEGNVKVSDKAETVELSHINSTLNLQPPGRQTDFAVKLDVVDKGKESKVSADGQVVPAQKTGWSLKGTSGEFIIEVNELDLESLGPIFALGGVETEAKGSISASIKTQLENGWLKDLSGTVKGRDLDITGGPLKGDRFKTSVLNVRAKVHSEKELLNIDKMEVQSDWLNADVTGTVPKTFESLAEFVKPDSAYNLNGTFECDLAGALSQMPRTFGIREGVQVTSGRLTGKVETPVRAGGKFIYASGNLSGLAGVVGGKTIALSQPVTAEVEITSDKAGVRFDKLNVAASFAKVNCTGTTELVKYEAEANLAKLQSELGAFVSTGKYEMAGELSSKGEVSSRKDRITAVGTSSVKELRLISTDKVSAFEPKADMDFSVVVESKQSVLDVNFINVTASLGQVSIKNAVLPLGKETTLPMKLPIHATNVDLEKLQPFAVLFASFPKQMQLAGTARSDLSVSSQKDTYYVTTDSTFIKNLKFSSPGKKPFEQKEVSIIADVEVNTADKSFAVKKLQLTSPQIKIYRANMSRFSKDGKTTLKGDVDYEYDWAALTAVAGPYLPDGLTLRGVRKDTLSFLSEYPDGQTDKLLANLTTKTKLGFEQAEYMGLNFGPAEAGIEVQNGLLTVEPFSATVNKGQFNFAGRADLKQKPAMLETPKPMQIARDVQVNDVIAKQLFTYLNPIFADALDVTGAVSFYCERFALPLAGGAAKKIQIIGTVSADKMRFSASDLLGQLLLLSGKSVPGANITIHPTRFILWDGFLRYDDMQIDVGDNPFNFKGVIGLDDSLNMTVTLPYTLKGITTKVDKGAGGGRISLPLKGTVHKPELDTSKLLEQEAVEKGLEFLEGLLKKK
ncbi:MAG TPA: hypothetical protein VMW16_08935 [Sedimentisphaerales bacterium]|nr:hypothetical protein [Sedimentisphaerales bacterium]